MSLEKLAAISNTRARINSLMIESLHRYAAMNAALDDLTREPNEEHAQKVDNVFSEINDDLLKIRNAITTLANVIVSDNGDVEEIDAVPDEDGLRLQ